jgi:hypothetical protein
MFSSSFNGGIFEGYLPSFSTCRLILPLINPEPPGLGKEELFDPK